MNTILAGMDKFTELFLADMTDNSFFHMSGIDGTWKNWEKYFKAMYAAELTL